MIDTVMTGNFLFKKSERNNYMNSYKVPRANIHELPRQRNMSKRREAIRKKQKNRLFILGAVAVFIVFAVFAIIFISSHTEPIANNNNFMHRRQENLPGFNIIDANEPAGNGQRIVIDPGHGGNDPGAVHGGVSEKDLNLSMAFRLRDYLEQLGYAVILTLESDVTLSLQERATTAKNAEADAFVSIHHNALDNDAVTEGIETWYNDTANELNAVFAGYVQDEIADITQAKDRGLRNSDRVILLRELPAALPSCLIEVGFLSSNKERERLICPDYQDKIARGIVNGIEKFFSGKNRLPEQQSEIISPPADSRGQRSENEKMIALTFDDGPGRHTQELLDLLAEHNSAATFFVLGDRITGSHRQILRNAVEQGSEVAGHTWSHRLLTALTYEEAKREIQSANDAIFEITGIYPKFLRAPFGLFNNDVRDISKELGLSLINWNIDPEDWRNRDVDIIYEHIIAAAGNGGIILLHDIYESTLEAMRRVIPALIGAGYRLVTVSELLGDAVPGNIYYNGLIF